MKSKIKKQHKNKQKYEKSNKHPKNELPTESDDPLIQLRGLGGLN